ncbi:MAG: nucleoside hydrolase [Nitrospirae bacterium]|nr:nucleoside hydrolase [Nitrospirota bacterium]
MRCRTSILLCLAVLASCGKQTPQVLLIIDDDVSIGESAQANGSYFLGGFGTGFGEIDGGLEIVYAVNSPGVKLLGVTTVFGNTWVDYAVESSHELLNKMGRKEIPVLRGAESPQDLGRSTEASEFIVRTARENPGEVVLVASGPVTNIATALREDPDLFRRVRSFYYLGGFLDPQRFPFMIDFNTAGDPDAADLVLAEGEGVNLGPDSVTFGAPFRYDDLDYLRGLGTEMSAYLALKIEPWIAAQSLVFGIKGFYPSDMAGLAVVLEPDLAQSVEERGLRVDVEGTPLYNLPKGRVWIVPDSSRAPVRIWQNIRAEEARKRYRERLR